MTTLSLHHCAKRIRPQTLQFVMALFEELGCKKSYWEEGATWAMIEQEGKDIDIQFIETDQEPQKMEVKRNSHIAFLSDNPKEDLKKVEEWVKGQGHQFSSGAWSDKELYFDCPKVFIDFVIEIMDRSIIES